MRGVDGGPYMEIAKAEVAMEHQMRKSLLLGVGLFVASLISLSLWGCGGSGETPGSASGTTVSVVFPQQSAQRLEEGSFEAHTWQHATSRRGLAVVISELIRFIEVDTAYAQVIPANVARILLRITGPGILDPIQHEIDPSTRRVTVDVPVGNARVFEVQAFPADLPIANFIGRSTANVSATGTNVTVNMQAVTLNAIQVTPTNPQIASGTVQRFTAMGVFSDGTMQNVTALVNWASLNTSVAVVSNADGIEGVASGTQEGTTQITATLLNVTGETTLTVTAAEVMTINVIPGMPSIALGTGLQFIATGLFTDGTSQDLTMSASWASSNPAVASISGTGRATALAVGTTTISATFQDVTGETLLDVTAAQLAAIAVTPTIASIALGTRLQFVATGLFTDGNNQDLTDLATWSSADTSVCTIGETTGLAIALTVGTCTISATFQAISGSAMLIVRDVELAAISITPATPTIAVGTQLQFTATGIFTDGFRQDLSADVTWASGDAAVAQISNASGSEGLATALEAGSALISATFQGISGSATLTVSDTQLIAVVVSPANATIPIGPSLQFTAVGILEDGTRQDPSTSATWTSSDTEVCTIDMATGLATGLDVGTCMITATINGISGSASLTLTDEELVAIVVAPANPTIDVEESLLFTATGIFSDGTPVDFTEQVTWTSTNENVATISNEPGEKGIAEAVGVGDTTITGTFDSIVGSTELTVTDEYYINEGNRDIGSRFASIIGTATLTVIMLGIFSRIRDGRTRKRIRR